jgi:hypothetical protein
MSASDRLREAVYQAALGTMLSHSDMADQDDEAVSRAITAAVMTGLGYVEAEGPRPYAEHAGEGEPPLGPDPWGSSPDGDGDNAYMSRDGGAVLVSVWKKRTRMEYGAHVRKTEIPAMCRAAYQAAGLPWPGGEVERLRERVRELESATCMPEVMAVVEAWGPHGSAGTLDLDVLGHALDALRDALRDAVRSGKRCGLHPATVEVLRASRAWCDEKIYHVQRNDDWGCAAKRWQDAGYPDLPREGGE